MPVSRGTSWSPVSPTTSRSGIERPGGGAQRGGRECGACCRASCSPARLITSRSSRKKCGGCSTCSLGDGHRRHFRRGRPCGAARGRSQGRRQVHRRRPGPERAAVLRVVPAPRWRVEQVLRGDFADVFERLADNELRADAILFDLGVSSMQLDRPERGFSYASDAPLDMRMDPSAEHSARELVNEASERAPVDIFRGYGEERYARQIARAIVRRRKGTRSSGQASSSRRSRPRSRPPRGSARSSSAPRLPGASHRRQRRAPRPRVRPSCGARRAAAGRAHGGDQLPLARGPDRQALLPARGARLHLPAGVPGLRLRARAFAARADEEGGPGHRGGCARRPRAGSARLRPPSRASAPSGTVIRTSGGCKTAPVWSLGP